MPFYAVLCHYVNKCEIMLFMPFKTKKHNLLTLIITCNFTTGYCPQTLPPRAYSLNVTLDEFFIHTVTLDIVFL